MTSNVAERSRLSEACCLCLTWGIGHKMLNAQLTSYMEAPDFPPSRIDCATQFADGDDDDDDSGGFGVGRGCERDR